MKTFINCFGAPRCTVEGTPLEMFMLKSILSIVVNLYLFILRRKMKFHIQDFSVIWPNPQFPGDLVTLTEEIVNRNVFCAGAYMLLNTNSLNYFLKLPLILLLRKSKHKHSIFAYFATTIRYSEPPSFSRLLASTLRMKFHQAKLSATKNASILQYIV